MQLLPLCMIMRKTVTLFFSKSECVCVLEVEGGVILAELLQPE